VAIARPVAVDPVNPAAASLVGCIVMLPEEKIAVKLKRATRPSVEEVEQRARRMEQGAGA